MMGLVASIATSTVWRWLQAERLRPWRYHFWQKISDPGAFLVRARPVLELYEQATNLLRQGIWVVCVDEKTSIQARKGREDPVPATADHPVHVAPRYARKGALQLFAGLSVADGFVFGCTRARKRFVDFQAFILEVLVPEAISRGATEIRLVLDNGPTHAPKQLETWLTEQQAIQQWPFTIQVAWLPKYASWLDQIEIWFSVLQRKVLTPNHFASLDTLTQRITDFIGHHNASAKPINWTYTVDKLVDKLGAN